jgi:hypothetical protein
MSVKKEDRVYLELIESRTLNSRVVYLRYRVARQPLVPASTRRDTPANGKPIPGS